MDELVAAAKAEGQLTTIALPHDWCGYGAVIDGFKAKYPEITVNELNPDAGSGDEVEAIKANKDNKGPQAPDVIDVGLSFGPSAKADGLIQPYKVSTWDSIPDTAKDAEGYWYGDYYGVLSFEVNKDLVKNAPGRLGRPAEGRVHQHRRARRRSAHLQPGDPGRLCRRPVEGRRAPAKRPATAGLEFFKELNATGNFVPVIGKAGDAGPGPDADPDHLGLQRARRPRHAERQPAGRRRRAEDRRRRRRLRAGDQRLRAAPECRQAVDGISLFGRRPARLAEGLLPPDPLRRSRQERQDPAGLLDKLPPAASYEAAVFPTLDEQGAAKEAITKNWDAVVGANVQ